MKVSELPYRRITLEEIKAVMEDVIARIRSAQSVEEILTAREDYLACNLEFYTNYALANMRYTLNTVDPFYCAENDYYDEIGPAAENCKAEYAAALLDSPFRPELEKALTPILFKSMEVSRKAVSPLSSSAISATISPPPLAGGRLRRIVRSAPSGAPSAPSGTTNRLVSIVIPTTQTLFILR